MADQRDCEGKERFTSIEGVTLLEPAVTAMGIILQMQSFPIYLLGASDTMIGIMMASAFESNSPPTGIPLFWVHELQRVEVVLQNMLDQDLCVP